MKNSETSAIFHQSGLTHQALEVFLRSGIMPHREWFQRARTNLTEDIILSTKNRKGVSITRISLFWTIRIILVINILGRKLSKLIMLLIHQNHRSRRFKKLLKSQIFRQLNYLIKITTLIIKIFKEILCPKEFKLLTKI